MYYVPDGTKECGYYECKKCGEEEVEKMDTLLSLALTGGDYSWI